MHPTAPMITARNPVAGYFWDQMCLTGTVFIPTTFFNFVLVFLGRAKKYILCILGSYAVSLVFLWLNWDHSFVREVKPTTIFNFYTVPSAAYTVFVLYFSILSTLSVYFLYRSMRHDFTSLKVSKQTKWLFFASCFGYVGGGTNFLLVYGINIPYFTPVANYAILAYGFSVAYIILKHKFLDIEVIIKKTLVFAGLFVMFMIVVSSVSAISQSFVGQYFKMGMMANGLVCSLFVALLYNPIHKLLVNATDKYLFQKKEDFKIILNRLAENVISELDLQSVGAMVLHTLRESLRLEAGALIVKDDKTKHYSLLSAFGLNLTGCDFSEESEFVQFCSKSNRGINLERQGSKNCIPSYVVKELDSLRAVICLPLYVQRELIGVLTMGKKLSDQEFTQEEIDYLPVVAGQTAIAIKNAQLVSDVVLEREEKIKAQNKAEQVNYASSLSHETGNALVGITSTSQNISDGLVRDLRKLTKYCGNSLDANLQKRFEEIADKIYRFSKTIEQNSEKIRMIIKTATGGLKDNRSEKEEISFRFVWNHAKKEANLNDVHYDGRMPDPFIVFGNVSLLTRVLVNLFVNSRDAMMSMAEDARCIHLEASCKTLEGRQVAWVEYWDDGVGVPEELFEKVFEQGFSTKPKPQGPMGLDSGYGQGLYYCRKFIEGFHGGRLWLEKGAAGGSKFVFWIPVNGEEGGEKNEQKNTGS